MNSSMVVSYSNNLPLEAVKVNSWLKMPLLFRAAKPTYGTGLQGKKQSCKNATITNPPPS